MALGSKKDKSGKSRFNRAWSRAGRAESDKQEARAAARFGGTVQRASGATARHKGDIKIPARGRLNGFLMEAKTVIRDSAKSIRIESLWLKKITHEADHKGMDPALEFRIPSLRSGRTEETWVAVPASVFAKLLELAEVPPTEEIGEK